MSRVASEREELSEPGLQRLVHADLRGLGAQASVRTVARGVDACAPLRANLHARKDRPGSKRRITAASKPVALRPDAEQPVDDRMLSWRTDERTVSIWTTTGRIKNDTIIAFVRGGTEGGGLLGSLFSRHTEYPIQAGPGSKVLEGTAQGASGRAGAALVTRRKDTFSSLQVALRRERHTAGFSFGAFRGDRRRCAG